MGRGGTRPYHSFFGLLAFMADVDAGFFVAVHIDTGGREAIAGVRILGHATVPFALLGFHLAHGDHAVGDGYGAFGHGGVVDFAGRGFGLCVIGCVRVAGGEEE